MFICYFYKKKKNMMNVQSGGNVYVLFMIKALLMNSDFYS